MCLLAPRKSTFDPIDYLRDDGIVLHFWNLPQRLFSWNLPILTNIYSDQCAPCSIQRIFILQLDKDLTFSNIFAWGHAPVNMHA